MYDGISLVKYLRREPLITALLMQAGNFAARVMHGVSVLRMGSVGPVVGVMARPLQTLGEVALQKCNC